MKKNRILLFICALLLVSALNAQSINYKFSKKVNLEICKGIKKYKQTMKNLNLKDSDFFIKLSEVEGKYFAILTYGKNRPYEKIVSKSNRYCEFELKDKKYRIPILFNDDFQFADFFENTDGTFTYYSINGYTIEFNSRGMIFTTGFTQ